MSTLKHNAHRSSQHRAQKVDSLQQLDLFADLSHAEHSDKDVPEAVTIEDGEAPADTRLTAASLAVYTSANRQRHHPRTSNFVHAESHIYEPSILVHSIDLLTQFKSKRSRKPGDKEFTQTARCAQRRTRLRTAACTRQEAVSDRLFNVCTLNCWRCTAMRSGCNRIRRSRD